jgi:enterochelin esterase-like enzyme
MTTPTMAEPHLTLEGLRALWAARDALYARRKSPLTPHDEANVRWFRGREATALPAMQATAGWEETLRWRAPGVMR